MAEIIKLTNGNPVVDSIIIADGVQIEHRAVLQIIRKYSTDFEVFGRVAFEMRPFETKGGLQKREVTLLNENQAMLLFTYLKNTEIARSFKIRLVQAFSDCRDALARAKASTPALLDYPTALRQLASSLEKQAALEHKVAEDAPKVAFAERVEASYGDMLIREAAKTLGYPATHLFDWLRAHSWITMKRGPREARRPAPSRVELHAP
jgi:anti-repressor protein